MRRMSAERGRGVASEFGGDALLVDRESLEGLRAREYPEGERIRRNLVCSLMILLPLAIVRCNLDQCATGGER